jgi:hypothetical protein
MKENLIKRFEEVVKEILKSSDEMHIFISKANWAACGGGSGDRLEIYFCTLEDCIGYMKVEFENESNYKTLLITKNNNVIIFEDVFELSYKFVVKKVIQIANSIGLEIAFSDYDWRKEESWKKECYLILAKS